MFLFVISAVLMVLFLLISAHSFTAFSVSLTYFLIIALFILPFGTIIWFYCRKTWHVEDIDGGFFDEEKHSFRDNVQL